MFPTFVNRKIIRTVLNCRYNLIFRSSAAYWENRYARHGSSGIGSYGVLAEYKAGVLNKFVAENKIEKVIEWGCGDGNQLQLFKFPSYIGLDVSATAIEKCKKFFEEDSSKSFFVYHPDRLFEEQNDFNAGLALSLDVVYHLPEDDIFENYMEALFASSTKFIIIYAWDIEGQHQAHVRHRKFSQWISQHRKDWWLKEKITKEEEGVCDFFIYEKCFN